MPEALRFTQQEKDTFRKIHAANSSQEQWDLFIQECERRALIPGTHVVFQVRNTTEYNQALNRRVSAQKVTLITTINALRLIAERSGKYDGHGPFVYYYGVEGGDLKESKIPLGKIPHAVSVEGFRKDWRVPLFATARFDAYKQTKKDGDREVLTKMWSDRSEEQLAKCCEALMLRTVSPEECAGLLISEELGNDAPDALEQLKELAGHGSGPVSAEEARAHGVVVTVPEPTVAPKVNQEACGFMTLEAPSAADLAKIESVPAPAVVTTVTQQAPTPAAQPTPAPIAPSTNPVSAKPSPGLFTETNRPDPAHETRVFQEPLAVDPALTAALAGVSNPSPVQSVSIPAPAVGDVPCDSKRYSVFVNERATKIIRDKLPKAGVKDAAVLVKNYLLKGAGKASLPKISAADFERLLSALEAGTPEEAAAIVTAK
jgi:hypothetical protein